MRRLLPILFFLLLLPALNAQTYLNATGAPPFTVPASVELGYANLSNGNLHLNVPFGAFPQRGAIGFSAGMIYDSRIWQVANNQWQPSNVANSQGGWRFATSVDPGTVNETTVTTSCGSNNLITNQNFVWTQPDGTQRFFPIQTSQNLCTGVNVTSGNAFAADSSGYHMYITNYTSATIFAKNGNRVFPTDEDTNGNYFNVDGNGNAVDTLGRTPVTKTVNGNQTYYDVLNSQGTTSRYTITSESINVGTNFGQSGVTEYSGTLTVIQSVGLPDGSSYSFNYDSGTTPGNYGLIQSVTLRTGGQITYSFTNFSDSYGNVNRWVNTRLSAGGTWTYAPQVLTTCAPGTTGCQQQVTVTQPSGDDTVYTFTLNNGAWPTQAQSYTGSASTGTLLKTGMTDFDFSNACPFPSCTGNAYIRPIRVTVTDPIPGSSILKKSEYSYDSIYYGNVNVQKEWLYYTGSPSATPNRETDTTFLTTSSYINKDILNRPTDIVVKNSSGTQVAETKYSYDTTTLTSATGDSNHDDINFGTGKTTRGNATQTLQWVSGGVCSPNTVSCLTTATVFDTTGQLRQLTDPKGNVTNYSYTDSFHTDNGLNTPPSYTPNTPTNAYLTKVTFPNSDTVFHKYYFHSGKLAFDVDENSHDTFRHYIDQLDRSTEIDTPTINTGTSHGWQIFTYPSVTEADSYAGITSTDPSTSCTSCRHDVITYDGNGRTTRNTLASDPDGQTFTDTTYDSTSRTSSVSNPYRSTSDPTYGLESFQYDGLDRATRNTHQDGNYAQSVYGAAVSGAGGTASQLCSSGTYGFGYPRLTIDEAGKKMQSWVDGFGRTIEADEPDSSGALTVGTCYQYDSLNNQTQVAQGFQTRTYGFDGLSRQTSAIEPESGTTTTFYTTSGSAICSGVGSNACRITDARSITTTYAYDSRDRLTSKTYSDTTHSVTYSYGQTLCNGLTITNGLNRRTCMTDAAGTTAWSYDPAGHIITEKRTVGTITKTISNTYNVDGSVAQKTYPSTNVITYTFSNAQRVTAVQNNSIGKNYATGITYAPQGTISSMLENQGGGFAGISYTRSYNNRLQVTATRATSSNGTAFDLTYSYDLGGGVNNGNLANLTNNRDTTRSVAYSYDTLNRISTAKTSASTGSLCWGQQFGYDRYANLLTVSKTSDRIGCSPPTFSLTVDTGNHISGDTYDSAGNLTRDAMSSLSYAYDAENHMTTGNSVTYTHDGDDWRVKKSNGDLEWHDTSCGGDLVDVFDLSGSLSAEYYYVGSMLFASRSLYYFGDKVDSVRVITNTTGTIQRESDYYAFGGELQVVTTISDVRKLNSKKRDTETSLDYSHFRMSNSTLGRWQSVDPVGPDVRQPQTLNRYGYVVNNPINLVDPTGLFAWAGPSAPDPPPLQPEPNGIGDAPNLGVTFGINQWREEWFSVFLRKMAVAENRQNRPQPLPQLRPQPDWTGFNQCCAAARAKKRNALLHALPHIIGGSAAIAGSFSPFLLKEGGEFIMFHGPGGAFLTVSALWYAHGYSLSDDAFAQYTADEGACQGKYHLFKTCDK